MAWASFADSGQNPDGQGFKSRRFFRVLCEKILLVPDGLDSRNGYRTLIVFGRKMCCIWYTVELNKKEGAI